MSYTSGDIGYFRRVQIFNFVLTRAKNVLPSEKLAAARQNVLQNCDFIIDIGANNGDWISKVRKTGYKGDALCIEPLKSNYHRLKNRHIPRTKCLNYAIGKKNGSIRINHASNNGLSSSILELNDYHIKAAPHVKFIGKQSVKMIKLSKLLNEHKKKAIYIKIDVQGYELQVLKSIQKSNFQRVHAFEIETNLVSTYKNASLIEDIIKFLRLNGYKPLRIESGLSMPNFGQLLQSDILFIKS
jgi:FkbM family methyltransferase